MNQDFLYDIGNVAGRTLDAPTMIARNLLAGNDLTSGVFSGEGSTPDDVESSLGIPGHVGGGAAGETIAMLLGGLLAGGLGAAFIRGPTAANKTAPGRWYSRLDKAVEALPDGNMSYQRMLNLLGKAKEGYSPEELSWRGLDKFSDIPAFNKLDILRHLEDHPMAIDEVVQGDGLNPPFKRYSLAGSAATSMSNEGGFSPSPQWPDTGPKYTERLLGMSDGTPGYNEGVVGDGQLQIGPFRRAPIDVIAHLRTTEHSHPDFGSVLFGNELQSDLHQEAQAGMHGGLPRGYTTPEVTSKQVSINDGIQELARMHQERVKKSDEALIEFLGGDTHGMTAIVNAADGTIRRPNVIKQIRELASKGESPTVKAFYDTTDNKIKIQLNDGELITPVGLGANAFIPARNDTAKIDYLTNLAEKAFQSAVDDLAGDLVWDNIPKIRDTSYADKALPKRLAKITGPAEEAFRNATGIDPVGKIERYSDADGPVKDWTKLADEIDAKHGNNSELKSKYNSYAAGDVDWNNDIKDISESPEYRAYRRDMSALSSYLDEFRKASDLLDQYDNFSSLPNYPYKKSWKDLLIRKLVDQAVHGGHDAIGVASPDIMTSLMSTNIENSNLPSVLKDLLTYMRTKDPEISAHETPLGHVVPMTKKFVDNIKNNGQYLMSALPIAALLAQGNNDG